MRIAGKVALVTGGGTGIGRSIASALARAGAAGVVVGYSRSRAAAEETTAQLSGSGCVAASERADVTDDDQVRALAAQVLDRFGRLDVLVNNAGATEPVAHEDLDGLTDEVWHRLLDVNLVGAFRCTRAFAAALTAAHGAVVNISSISALRAGGSSIAYGVSKAGLLQLTRNLAVALAPEVRVNAVVPGTVDTEWQTRLHGAEGFAELVAAERQVAPLRRTPGPEHVAEVVLGLLGMDLVTGESVTIDAGKHVKY